MPTNPASTEPETLSPPRHAAEIAEACLDQDAEFYCEMLDEIMQAGIELARMIRQTMRENPATLDDYAAAALAIERIARMVRRGILLVCKLRDGKPIRAAMARSRTDARARVRAEVQAAQSRAPPETAASSNCRAERPDSLGPGTIPEIIAGLCHELVGVATQLGHPAPRRLRKMTQRPERRPERQPDQRSAHRSQPPNPARAKGSG